MLNLFQHLFTRFFVSMPSSFEWLRRLYVNFVEGYLCCDVLSDSRSKHSRSTPFKLFKV